MADKEKKEDPKDKAAAKDDASNATVDAQPADKTKSVVMILIILSILVLILTPVITIFAIKSIGGKMEESVEIEKTKADALNKTAELKLGTFTFNVKDTQGTRTGVVDIVVEVSSAEMEKYFKDKTPENSSGMLNKVKSIVLGILCEKTLDGLLSKDAKIALSKEIKSELNETFKGSHGVVTDVYFPSFIVR